MQIRKVNSISDDLKKYDYLAKEHDYIEITEWSNSEGHTVDLNGLLISLTHGQLKAINHLVNCLELER